MFTFAHNKQKNRNTKIIALITHINYIAGTYMHTWPYIRSLSKSPVVNVDG